MFLRLIIASLSWGCITSLSYGDIIVPGANGSDGPLNCGTLAGLSQDWPCGVACPNTAPITYTIDLSQAANRVWDFSPPPVRGRGVYDFEKWAVVFKYSCVDIPSNVTIKFTNHPSRAPVVWLVNGDVNIEGAINLSAGPASLTAGVFTEPGPGGFRGGAYGPSPESLPSAGLGPGGGSRTGFSTSGCYAAGSYATVGIHASCANPTTYGNARVLPLIGGSGGAPWNGGGGAGGGAILIACAKTITHGGMVTANGSAGHGDLDGSGGAIRLVAESIRDSAIRAGTLSAVGETTGGVGRIRIEANSIALAATSNPSYTSEPPGSSALLWPDDLEPLVQIKTIGGQTAPTDPRASLEIPGADATVPNHGSQLVVLEAQNVPLDWAVVIRMVPRQGPDMTAQAAFVGGNDIISTWQATLPLPAGFTVLQARAYKQTAAAANADESEDPEAHWDKP